MRSGKSLQDTVVCTSGEDLNRGVVVAEVMSHAHGMLIEMIKGRMDSQYCLGSQ